MENKHRNRSMLFFLSVLLLWSPLQMAQAVIQGEGVGNVEATRTVVENLPIGSPVGKPFGWTSSMADFEIIYEIIEAGSDNDLFAIDRKTGQISTKVVFDYETVTYSDPTNQRFQLVLDVSECRINSDCMGENNRGQRLTGIPTVYITITKEPPSPPEPTPETTPVPIPVPTPNPTPDPTQENTQENTRETTRKKVIIRGLSQCALGWAPQSQYQHHAQLPKVMIYALEFEFINGDYTCSAIEIRTGDATLSHLEGWQLYLGTRYNPSRLPITLTQENSQFTDQILKLTPESLGQQTLACSTLYASGQPLPSVRYELKNENHIHIDRAYSCYRWGQIAVTPARLISPRRISSQALLAMDPPRIERYITNPAGVFRTYIDFAAFGWDRAVFSDWLLAASDASDIRGGNAPSSPYTQLTTSWGALKLRKTDRRHKRR